jgi:erythromycin esterase-like protein
MRSRIRFTINTFECILSRAALMAAVLAVSCAGPSTPPSHATSKSHRISGTILDSAGAPAPRVAVVITNSSADEIASTETDARGRFSLDVVEPRFALASATNREWVYVPDLDGKRTDLRVKLRADCTRFRGKIELDDPAPRPRVSSIRIGGFDKDVYTLFPINVATDLSFEACLPPREYYVTFPDSIANRTVLARVPPVAGVLELHAATRKHVTAVPARPVDLAGRSRGEMIAHLPRDIRVLGLAESNHGTLEFYEERTDLAIELARRHRYLLIMLEAGFGEALLMDDYVKGADVAIADALKATGYWMWRSKEVIAALDELRAYNLGVPASDQISIAGIDVQTTKGALAELRRQGGGAVSEPELALLSRLHEQDGKKWAEFSADDKELVRSALTRLASMRDTSALGSITNRQALAARSILLRLDLLEQGDYWNRSRTRDAGMARMASEVLALMPQSRATLWAHIFHLSREFVVGAPTMGTHLAASLGGAYQVWALLALEGAARARSAKRDGQIVAHELPPRPDYLVEAVLWRSGRAHGLAVSYWTLPREKSSRDSWLRGLRLIRAFGGRFTEHREPFELFDLASLDGFVLFKRVSPTAALE